MENISLVSQMQIQIRFFRLENDLGEIENTICLFFGKTLISM